MSELISNLYEVSELVKNLLEIYFLFRKLRSGSRSG